MPTPEELHAADKAHAAEIARLSAVVRNHDETLTRHREHLERLDAVVSNMRETVARLDGKVATKDDISLLREDMSKRFFDQLQEANRSWPANAGAWFTGVVALIAILTFSLTYFHGH